MFPGATAPIATQKRYPALATSGTLENVDFSILRYAQCWEDADILLEGLDVQPGEVCLSIASAGDNTLSILTRNPAKVIAVDLSPAQIASLELRVAAYRRLSHQELLEFLGVGASERRLSLYAHVRPLLSVPCRAFWDQRTRSIAQGVVACGKFERYFRIFRTFVLPLIHGKRTLAVFRDIMTREQREKFYECVWDCWRWRVAFRIFFSRFVMGRLGRDPRFFRYVEGSVGDKILARARHALTDLDPRENPYLQWIALGTFETALPHALRVENFGIIRENLDRLEWHIAPVSAYLEGAAAESIHRFNMSDIFEYMSESAYEGLLGKLLRAGRRGGRIAYWNLLAPRSHPESLSARLIPLTELATNLHQKDKAFFYCGFIVEEIA